MCLLEIKSASASYGDVDVLKDVSLSVNDREILSIVGANSAGKSTLLKAISGEIPLTGGDIIFNVERISMLKTHIISRMGVIQVPEGRRIFPFMTVIDNLFVASSLSPARNKRAESLENVYRLFPKLKERKEQLGGTLSGGEQQMLAIARGLMTLPKLLMLDEPSVGLSPVIVNNIFHVIKEINDQGITILLVEQNVQKSLSLADRGYVLEGGKIVLEGASSELLANPHIKDSYLGL